MLIGFIDIMLSITQLFNAKPELLLIRVWLSLTWSVHTFFPDMFVMLHYLGWNYTHLLPARFLRHELSSYLSEDVGSLLVVKECGHTCGCPTRTSLYKANTPFFLPFSSGLFSQCS